MSVAPDPDPIMGLYLLTAYIEALTASCRVSPNMHAEPS
jgi:hypothetical protein